MIKFDIDLPLEFELIAIEEFSSGRTNLLTFLEDGWFPVAVHAKKWTFVRCKLTNLQLIKLLREQTKIHNANN